MPQARPGGYLAFTDAVWRKENPPADVKAAFDLDYPAMGRPEDSVALDQMALEPPLHRRHGDFYAYEFFVARRALGQARSESAGQAA